MFWRFEYKWMQPTGRYPGLGGGKKRESAGKISQKCEMDWGGAGDPWTGILYY